jgi:electron transfer flavoprotein beta subunit
MKILVCISCAPDTTSKIAISDHSQFNLEGLTFIVGPYDDYALSRAIELKESENAEVVVLHVGNSDSEPLIRKCLALGADRAVRINVEPKDSQQVSNEICAYVNENPFDLILMGKETIDYGNAIVPALVAASLNFPMYSPVQKLQIVDSKIEIEVETIKGKATILSDLPAVLGCQEPIAEWKIPNMRGIMAARTKELTIINPQPHKSPELTKLELVETERKGIMIEAQNAEQIIDLLFKA